MTERHAPPEISLRPITDADLPLLCRLYASTREEELRYVDWSPEQKEAFLTMQFEAQHRFYQENYPGAEFSMILRAGEPAGRLYLDRRPAEIRVIDIALLPEHRNAGLGSALLRDIQTEGAAAGKPVTIHVERFNPALHMYARLGFHLLEDKGPYLLMEWRPEG